MNQEQANVFLGDTNRSIYRVNKKSLRYPSTSQDAMNLTTSPLPYHHSIPLDPLYCYTPSRESNGSSPGYSQLLRPIKLDMPQINLDRLYGCVSPILKNNNINHSVQENMNRSSFESSVQKMQRDNSNGLKIALTRENAQSQSSTFDTFSSRNTKEYNASKGSILKSSLSSRHVETTDEKITESPDSFPKTKHTIPYVRPCNATTFSLSVEALPKISHTLGMVYESNEESKRNVSFKKVDSNLDETDKDVASLSYDGSVDNDKTLFDSDFTHTPASIQDTVKSWTPSTFSERVKIFSGGFYKKKTAHSNGVNKPHNWNTFLSLSFQLSQNVPLLSSTRCLSEKETLPWLPLNFPCQSISTNNGNFGLNTLNECYFSFVYENELRSNSSWNVPNNLSDSLYLYFFVEKRGKGKIRTQLCHVNQHGTISSTLAVTEWNNYQVLPPTLSKRFQQGRLLFELLKANTSRVYIFSSEGWKSCRVFKSYTLPFLFFPNLRFSTNCDFAWCFYLMIPSSVYLPYVSYKEKNDLDSSVLIFMETTGCGSIHSQNGNLLSTFSSHGNNEHDGLRQYFEYCCNDHILPTLLRSKVMELARKLFTFSYVLEVKGEQNVLHEITSKTCTFNQKTSKDFITVSNETMACIAQDFDVDTLNKYVWFVQATREHYTQDQLIQFVNICLHRLHGDLQPGDIVQCFHDAFQRIRINEETINVTTESILNQFQEILEHLIRQDEATFNKALVRTTATNEVTSVVPDQESEDISLLFHGCLFYIFLFVQRIAGNGTRCCFTTPNALNTKKTFLETKKKEKKSQPANNSVVNTTHAHLFMNIFDIVLHHVSFINTNIHKEDNCEQFKLCNMLHLDIWSSILCEIVYRLLLGTETIFSPSVSTADSASELSRPARSALHRFLETAPDLLLLFLQGEENIIHNSCFLKTFLLLLICPQIPRSSLHLNTHLQKAFLTWILSYAGDPFLHRVFILLGCYIHLPKLNISDRCKDGLPRDTLLTDSLWNGLMTSALENIQKDLEVFLQLDNMEQLEEYALSCVKHTSSMLSFASELSRFLFGNPFTVVRDHQPKLHLLVCHGFPLKQLLKITIQFLESTLNTIKTSVEFQAQTIFSFVTEASTPYCDKKNYRQVEKVLFIKEKIFKDMVSLILSILKSIPKCYLLLYSRMLQRLILTCLGLSSKHMTTWNQVSLQETYTLQTWVFQCRYSAEIWCILDCLLCNTSSLFEQGKWRDLLLAHLQQTLAFIVNPTTHVLLLFQKYVDGNKELFVSNEHFLFNLVSPPKMALCVQGLLQCVFSNQVSDFQPWRYALQESTHCFTTKCLIISLDVLSVTRTLLTQLDHKLTDVTLLAECDEHVLRLLWQAALTGSSFTLQTENPIDLWKTPSLTKTNVDRRLLLLESLVEFLHVSHVYHYAISPTFLSVVISVLNRVKPKCQTFIPTFYSRDENYAHLEKNVEEKITHFIHLLKSSFYGRFHSEGNNIVEQTRIKNYLDSFLRKQQPSRNVFETDTPLCDATLHRSEDEANNVEKFSTFDLTTSNSSTQGNVLAKKTEPLSSHMMPKASDNEKDIYENVEHTPVQVSFNQNTASENLHSSFRFTTLTNEITMHDCLSVKNEQLTTGFNVNQQSLYPPVKENPQTTPTSSVHSISSHNSLKYSDSHTAEEKDVLFETCNNDEMLHCTTPLAHSSDTDVSVQSNDIQFSSIHLLQSYDEALSTSQPEHQCEITSVLRYCGFNVSETPKKEEQSKAILQTPQASCDSDTFATIETDPQNTLSDSICKENLDTNFINNATPSPSNCTRTFKVDKDSQQMNDDDFLAALEKMSLLNTNVNRKNTVFLFDMDGTLTKATSKCDISVARVLEKLKKHVTIGIVSGSSLDAISYQFQPSDSSVTVDDIADYIFSQNGTVARFHGACLGEDLNIQSHLGESQLQELLNFTLNYIANLRIPIKRGTFIQLRSAMINISPIGRDCSLKERELFFEYDKKHHVRQSLIQHLEKNFRHLNLRYTIGGQISIDCYPIGWDKSFCLRHLSDYDSIFFFGDKTSSGGNDYEIYHHPNVIGQTVQSPEDTLHHVEKFLNLIEN